MILKRPVVALTAEYNPFHRGHQYQIDEIRRRLNPEAIVVILSSHFLQRGIPSLLHRNERALCALRCGADLVLELPLPFSCHNAGVFASGAVTLARSTSVVDTLSFGMEDSSFSLDSLLDILVQEGPAFKKGLHNLLQKGFSYAAARATASEKLLPGAGAFLSQPNNTLAVAYLEAAARQNWKPSVFSVQRQGSGYHDAELNRPFASATAIRQALAEGKTETALDQLPPPSAAILRQALEEGRVITSTEKLWSHIKVLLHRESPESLGGFAEFGEGIEHRIKKFYRQATSLDELVEQLSTRRYPRTRLQRQLLYLLLNLKQQENREAQQSGPLWIRPLAASAQGLALLRRMKEEATLPLLHRLGDVDFSAESSRALELQLRGSLLWESLVESPQWNSEVQTRLMIQD